MTAIQTIDRRSIGETNGLIDGLAYHKDRHQQEGGVEIANS